jgi:Glycosyltransferase
MLANIDRKIAFLSTYPPRECGLATFTEDLVKALTPGASVAPCVIAVGQAEKYADPRVQFVLDQHERAAYARAARWANRHADLVVMEHEYGIFGGDCGEYVLDLAKALTVPLVVTTHTVLAAPSPKQRMVLRELGRLSAKVVTMAKSAIPILEETYAVSPAKIVFIPHGVPRLPVASREQLKRQAGLANREVISSFGLISPAKGLEYGIEALAKVVPDYENVVYLILGKTHPALKQSRGEGYRQSLVDLAARLGVGEHVRFIDKYLTKQEIITYLQMSDMYLTPYLSAEQAVSGTLAYAVGYGRVAISTPYRYAKEMLGDGRGLLTRFRDADSLAACIRTVLDNPSQKREMEMSTLAVGRTMTWEQVAKRYNELCASLADKAKGGLVRKEVRLYPEGDPVPFPLDGVRHGMKAGL